MTAVPYLERTVDAVLDELAHEAAAILLVGPRASGKTTTAARRVDTVIRLDDPAQRLAVAENPDATLAAIPGSILIDEWQLVPEVLGAVKRAVDLGAPSGRFIITGSTRADLMAEGWPATGRILRLELWPLSRREIEGHTRGASIIDQLIDDAWDDITLPDLVPDINGYLDAAMTGGFPSVVGPRSERFRREWLHGYVDQTVMRDALLAGPERDPRRLRRYLQAIAANTAGIVTHKTLFDSVDLNQRTAQAYDGLLELLHVTEQVPAWSNNRLNRLAHASKRYIVEPSLLGPLLNIDRRALIRNGDLIGRVIDTFVAAQLRAELGVAQNRTEMYHLRTGNGEHEIDLILEGPGGRIIGIEIKAASAPDAEAIKHLIWLRDRLGDQFAGGVLFHTGPRIFHPSERIIALPICALWG